MNEQQGTRKAGSKPRFPQRKSVIAAVALLVALVACAAVVLIFAIHNSLEVPRIERPKDVVWLPQNWTEDQRRRYYHTAQGSELLPYAWFLALEQPRFSLSGAPPFKDDRYLQGFGFIPDPALRTEPRRPAGWLYPR